uniref:Uncharacterized protein n=1 Tax=Steinernema glaseri TaxID=37863 RepID=A0A1I7Z4H2_9BILA
MDINGCSTSTTKPRPSLLDEGFAAFDPLAKLPGKKVVEMSIQLDPSLRSTSEEEVPTLALQALQAVSRSITSEEEVRKNALNITLTQHIVVGNGIEGNTVVDPKNIYVSRKTAKEQPSTSAVRVRGVSLANKDFAKETRRTIF